MKQLFCNIRTVFGDIFLTEFEDPVLAAHVSSVAITDIPHNLQVSASYVHVAYHDVPRGTLRVFSDKSATIMSYHVNS